jgi:polysaccharide deacetylase 2 family uncharacterized protein YibQ
MKKRSSRLKNQKNILTIVIVVLIFFAGAAALIIMTQGREKGPDQALLPTEENGSPELMIKGCLFELGIARKDVRFSGRAVDVTLHKPLSEVMLSRAFSPVKDMGDLDIESARLVRVVIDGQTWNIRFSGAPGKTARCAIIVDDMGLNLKWAKDFCAIDADLTFSVLPDRPYSEKAARYLHSRGKEVLLHQPMQGNGMDPGKGAIYQNMSRSEIRSVLRHNMQSVPHVRGVNNHMGSRITPDEDIMRLVLQDIRDRGLFFVDSLTTSKSVCRALAPEIGIPFIVRDVFLDNERADSYIVSQIDKLVKISRYYSDAVAICHPYPETLAVLAREIPRIRDQGVEIVRVSALIAPAEGSP